jgi:hypothetical protein
MARDHITPTLGGIRLKDLKALHIQTLYAAKFDAGYSLRTRRYIHTTLNKALKQAVRWNQLAVNPAADVEVPRACYELGRKLHRNADSTVGLIPLRSPFPAFLSRFQSSS